MKQWEKRRRIRLKKMNLKEATPKDVELQKLVVIYIPRNARGIRSGYYTLNRICQLLRIYANEPDKIYFLADMLEL